MLHTVSEVAAKLGDKGFSAPHVVEVNKGSKDKPRFLKVIEWHEVVRMLDEAFGPFGWDAEIVSSHTDYANGVYTVDMTLTGRAVDDETGDVVTLKRPGRGVGLVPRSAMNSDAEHDRQAHGAKSDAITNGSKALGDGFGLYLYKNGEAAQNGGAARQGGQAASSGGNGSDRRPSEGQMRVLTKNGYPEDFVAKLEFKQWKGIIDALLHKDEDGNFDPQTPPIAPPEKAAVKSKSRPAPTDDNEEDVDDIPW